MPVFKRHDSPPLRELAYDSIRDAILDGSLAAGQRIKERDVASQMGISTTPVKEALRRLEQEGLIVSQPRRGAVVAELALTSVEEIVAIRARLESLAAKFAASRATEDELVELRAHLAKMGQLTNSSSDLAALEAANAHFHDLVRGAARNVFLNRFVAALEPFDRSVRHQALADRAEARRGFAEHSAVLEAIEGRDGDQAAEVMLRHISRSAEFVVGQTKARRRGGAS